MLNYQNFLIKEHAGIMKLTDTYDIFDADSGKHLAVAKEEPGALAKWLRLIVSKKMMSTTIECRTKKDEELVFSIHKPFTFFRSHVNVLDADGERLGYFKSKILSIGGGFYVYDDKDKQIAEIKGKWTGWDFKFVTPDGEELGKVSKKWAGLAKELFTSADNYVVSISDDLADQEEIKILLLAAALAIDAVYYEQGQ